MIVALGALDARAEEQLRRVLRAFERLARIAEGRGVIVRGRIGQIAALAAQEIGDDFIERAVGRDLAAQPLVITEGGFAGTAAVGVVLIVRADLKNLRPTSWSTGR